MQSSDARLCHVSKSGKELIFGDFRKYYIRVFDSWIAMGVVAQKALSHKDSEFHEDFGTRD